MRSATFLVSLLATAFVSAQEIDNDDIPQECRDICRPVVELADRCDNFDNDNRERDCLCETQNAAAFTSCNDCTLQYPNFFIDNDDDDDNTPDRETNEVNLWLNRCNFGSSSGNNTSSPTGAASTGSGVVPVSTSTGGGSTVVVVSPTGGAASATGGAGGASGGSNNGNSNGNDNNVVTSTVDGAAAAATGAPVLAAGLLAAAALAVL
ncbi:unnamed protein product [Zymoseptoria tritici ST99CH_3D1]|uniref:Extracellular membrane protein CFEM domain-containing protein n=1 Tax=Zymoseptoria tritici ST99CH_1E4 TaxID=1276532 RepID=A0A2H1GGH8_ZYMTR|nr:unnamed protein product [Zymoseptoria tritici ST99CH_1E4]SMR53850.1 unnamed protein product [Zymoseptoria tritici ST99CH_3D1]